MPTFDNPSTFCRLIDLMILSVSVDYTTLDLFHLYVFMLGIMVHYVLEMISVCLSLIFNVYIFNYSIRYRNKKVVIHMWTGTILKVISSPF